MAVIDNAFETQGTELFFVDPDTAGAPPVPAIVKLTCPTGITGIAGGTKDQIDTTCLDVTDGYRTFIGGLATGDQVAVPFILYDKDPGHQALFDLKDSNANVEWLVGLSDSADPPTLTGSTMTPPATRTSFTFNGYVANLTLDASTNEVVRGNLTIQVVGKTTPHWVA